VSPTLRAETHGDILVLRFDHPSGYPRLTRALLEQLRGQLDALAHSAATRAVVLTGTDRAFAVGAEISEIGALTPVDARDFSLFGQSVMRAIERFNKPVVAAIRGYCFGGGLDLALACHARVASVDAAFSHPGGSLGILTGWGGTQRLPRTLLPGARGRALELLATGRTVVATEALAIGLVSRIVPSHETLVAAMAMIP
jgi:enoyl-CoA hydratase